MQRLRSAVNAMIVARFPNPLGVLERVRNFHAGLYVIRLGTAKNERMIKATLSDSKVYLSRDDEDRKPLLERLSRIEGQIRGIRAMVEADRYCGDELQQVKAAMAALREFAIILAEQHILSSSALPVDGKKRERVNEDIARVLREALRF